MITKEHERHGINRNSKSCPDFIPYLAEMQSEDP